MAYNTEKLYEQALKIIDEIEPYWIVQLVAYMPCSRETFYDHFPIESDKLDTIKAKLEEVRIKSCLEQDKKWALSDNPTLQMGWRKLNGTDDERRKLSQTYQDITTGGDKINEVELTEDQIDRLLDKL